MLNERHGPGPRFATLFADPGHYRADCRLLRTAIRRGWLDGLTDAERRALGERFNAAMSERWASDPEQANARALLAEAWTMLEMDRDNTEPVLRLLRYAWGDEWRGRLAGRPRERWYVTDYPNRLDAAAIQRDAKRDGRNPLAIGGLTVTYRDDDGERTGAVELVAMPDRFRRVKLWLVCPRCTCRRRYLYPVRAGVWCRTCAGIAYAPVNAASRSNESTE